MKAKSMYVGQPYVLWGNVIPLFLMCTILIIGISVLCTSCTNGKPTVQEQSTSTTDIDTDALNQFNALTPPVRLLAKDMSFKCWGVTLIDGRNKVITLGNMTTLANQLGASYKIGDTIVKPLR